MNDLYNLGNVIRNLSPEYIEIRELEDADTLEIKINCFGNYMGWFQLNAMVHTVVTKCISNFDDTYSLRTSILHDEHDENDIYSVLSLTLDHDLE